MSTAAIIGTAVFLLLPSIIVYLLLFLLYRRLLRRPVSRRRRVLAIGIAVVLFAVIYGGPIYDLTVRGAWSIGEMKRGDTVKIAEGQPVYLSYLKFCTRDCAKLLLSGRVPAVYTRAEFVDEPFFPLKHISEPLSVDAPVMEWRLTNRPGACDDERTQKIMMEYIRYGALLAQGYCVTATRLEWPADAIEIWQRVWTDDANPRRRVWEIARIAEGQRDVLLRQASWQTKIPVFPPVFAFKIYYFPIGIGPLTIPIAISSEDFGTAMSDLTDLSLPGESGIVPNDRLGPLLIDAPEAAARAALRSSSSYMQHSAVALICLMHQSQPDLYPARFREELKILEKAKNVNLRLAAGNVLRANPSHIQCGGV